MGHLANWYAGWAMLLAAFLTGIALGLGFAKDDFLGGYGSWRRRLLRLGHIALAALGILNMVFGIASRPAPGSWQAQGAAAGLIVGGFAMPVICFLAAWHKPFRMLFPIPVIALILAAVCVLLG